MVLGRPHKLWVTRTRFASRRAPRADVVWPDAVVWSDTNFLPNFLPELPDSPSPNLTLPSLCGSTNNKLIDRATRYVAHLADLEYHDACKRVFAALEEVDPALRAGRLFPPVVPLAVAEARR